MHVVPLRTISGYGRRVSEGVPGRLNEMQHSGVPLVQSDERPLIASSNSMVSVAHLEIGQVENALENIALDEALWAGVEIAVRRRAAEKDISFDTTAAQNGGFVVRADAGKLDRTLVSLLSNAVELSPLGGLVTVTCIAVGDVVWTRVTDTGKVMRRNELALMFQQAALPTGRAFADARPATMTLALGRLLAREMGGDVTAVSRVGGGSTFTLALPRAR